MNQARLNNPRMIARRAPVGFYGDSPTSSAQLGRFLLIFCIVAAALSLGTTNPWLTASGILLPAVFWQLLWRPGHPAILFFGAMFQWLQAYTPIVAANLEGRTLRKQFGGDELWQAAGLSLLAVLVLACGMNLARKMMKSGISSTQIALQAERLSIHRLFIAYLITSLLSAGLMIIASHAGGLRQPILAFATIKWFPIFLISWTTIQHRKKPGYLLLVLMFEILAGFTGFFSSFKSILFMVIVVGLGTTLDSRRIRIAPILVSTAGCLLLASFWQAIKVDYREFLNQGTGMQVVSVPVMDRFAYLGEAVLSTTPDELKEGAISGILRLGYIEYFAYCIRSVPKRIPHQHGQLWLDAVKHTFMPRILFPNKPVINESKRTSQFTMIRVAGADRGTSITIGYPGESYIDFGVPLMFVPIFLLGAFYSYTYESLAQIKNGIGGVALATALLLPYVVHMAASNTSLVGGLTTGFIAFLLCASLLYQEFGRCSARRDIVSHDAPKNCKTRRWAGYAQTLPGPVCRLWTHWIANLSRPV